MDNSDEIMRALGRIEGKLTELERHGIPERMRAVEKTQAWYAGAAAVVAVFATKVLQSFGWTA